jgi:hypothetical protein
MSGSLFAHVGGDVGVANSWRAGASFFASKPRDRTYDDVDSTGTTVTNSFSGTSNTTVLDFVWKWAPDGGAKERGFTFQSEWFRRKESGDLSYDTTAASLGTATDTFRSSQSGFYAQGVWQFRPHWRAGYRYDQLSAANLSVGLLDNAHPRRRRPAPPAELQAQAAHRDGGLLAFRVLAHPLPGRARPDPPRHHGQPGLGALHHEHGRPRRPQILGEAL